MTEYTPERVSGLAERLRQIAESQRMDFDSPHVGMTLDESADALTAVSAERDEAREAAEDHVLAAEATYERLMPRIKKAEAERDRLHKAITEALAEHDRQVAERAWDHCLDEIEKYEINTQQAREGSPYRAAKGDAS